MSEEEIREWKKLEDSMDYDDWLNLIDEEFYGQEEI